jgi:hypothetical protein
MNIRIERQKVTKTAVFGQLFINGNPFCYTLERPEVMIPPGRFPVEITFSPRFNRPLPLLDQVPGRSAIRIHAGNWPRDSDGCILVGLQVGDNMVLESLMALNPLVVQIQDALDEQEPVWCAVL